MTHHHTIALVGDFNDAVIAHQAIPKALDLSAARFDTDLHYRWLHTADVGNTDLSQFSGIWCVPASPYESLDGALAAIRFARESGLPFLGTCGGYQHAVLEFARHVLGHASADNSEVVHDTDFPLISALVCRLIEKSDTIGLTAGSAVSRLYQNTSVEEAYHCSFGVNREYLSLFEGSDLHFVGFDESGDPRVFELAGHTFFVGTAYQPERWALRDRAHPLIEAFVQAVCCR